MIPNDVIVGAVISGPAPNVENAFSTNNANSEKLHIIGVRNAGPKRSTVSFSAKDLIGSCSIRFEFRIVGYFRQMLVLLGSSNFDVLTDQYFVGG